jgi:hypothetical protein
MLLTKEEIQPSTRLIVKSLSVKSLIKKIKKASSRLISIILVLSYIYKTVYSTLINIFIVSII